MPLLTYTSTGFPFTPFTKISSADVNQCFNDVKTLLNTTKLDSTNIQTNGITVNKLTPGAAGKFIASNGTTVVYVDSPLGTQYNIIIGSAADVTAGLATHSTFASYTPVAGDRILLLQSYATTENVTLNVASLVLRGQGALSKITGTLTLGASASEGIYYDFRITDNISLAGDKNSMTNIIFATTKTWLDSGLANYFQGIQEG